MSILKTICITNYVFRSTTERRGTLDTLPRTPGTVSYFTSLSCANIFPFHYCDHSITMILCSGLSDFFEQQNGKRRQQIMWLVHVWLDYQLSFEYLQSHLAHSSSRLSSTYQAVSALICGLLWGHTAGIPKLFQEFSSVRTVRDGTCVWLTMWDIWGTATRVVVGWSHHCVTCYFTFDLNLTLSQIDHYGSWGPLCLTHFIILDICCITETNYWYIEWLKS